MLVVTWMTAALGSFVLLRPECGAVRAVEGPEEIVKASAADCSSDCGLAVAWTFMAFERSLVNSFGVIVEIDCI